MASRPDIPHSALLERISSAPAQRLTVLTPNHRLALALQDDVDRRQAARGLSAWEAPDILHFEAFVERAYGEALLSEGGPELPALLTAHEEQVLWEEAVRASDWRDKVLSPSATAALAAEAW